MEKAKLQWKVDKLVKLAGSGKGIMHSDALWMMHLTAEQLEEIIQKATKEGLISVLMEKGTTKHSRWYRATGKEVDSPQFVDVTEEVYPGWPGATKPTPEDSSEDLPF